MKTLASWKQLIVCAVLISAAAFAWQNEAKLRMAWSSLTGTQPSAPQERQRAEGVPVIVATVGMRRDDRAFTAIGTGFAVRSVTLRAPSGGEITSLGVSSGRRFTEGATLMRLDDTDQRFAVSLAEERLNLAGEERTRYRRLQDSGVAAAARLQQVESDFNLARIELEKAREDLDNRILRAPFDGITGIAAVEIGDRIAADDPVSGFDDRSRILVEFDLPEALLGRVSTGLPVSASTPSAEGLRFDGRISAIDSRVDAATRTARVRASVINEADLLRPGTSFELQLELPGAEFPVVPELALLFSEGSLHVWRVSDGKAEKVNLRMVRRSAGTVIVDGPLSKGDLVVVEGTQRLRPGSSVNVLNTPGGQQS